MSRIFNLVGYKSNELLRFIENRNYSHWNMGKGYQKLYKMYAFGTFHVALEFIIPVTEHLKVVLE